MLALEMTSPRNRHCANCIGALSFPIINGGLYQIQNYNVDSAMPIDYNRFSHHYCVVGLVLCGPGHIASPGCQSNGRLKIAAAGQLLIWRSGGVVDRSWSSR